MREDHERNGLPPPDEDAVRSQFLGEGVPTPDLLTVKDFLRFYVAAPRDARREGSKDVASFDRGVYGSARRLGSN